MLNVNLMKLQVVSSSLDVAIDKANNLPEAENLNSVVAEQQALITELSAVLDSKSSGGKDIETCQINITSDASPSQVELFYTDENITWNTYNFGPTETSRTIQVAKETIIYVRVPPTNTAEFSGGFYELYDSYGCYFAVVTDDGQIYIPESLPA